MSKLQDICQQTEETRGHNRIRRYYQKFWTAQTTESSNKKTYKQQRLTHDTDSLHCKTPNKMALNKNTHKSTILSIKQYF